MNNMNNINNINNAQKHVYVLMMGTKAVGIVDNNKSYIFAFFNHSHVHLIRHNITNVPIMKLERNDFENADALMAFSTIDLDAKVSFKKIKQKNKSIFLDVHQVDMDNIMKYPYENEIGLIIPDTFLEETDDYYSFKCQIIDPII